jgi:transposase
MIEHLTRAQMEERRISAIPDLLALKRHGPHDRYPTAWALAVKYGVSRVRISAWRRTVLAAIAAGKDPAQALAATKATGKPWAVRPDLLRAVWKPDMTGRTFADAIEQAYGVRYHEDSACVLMHRLGVR